MLNFFKGFKPIYFLLIMVFAIHVIVAMTAQNTRVFDENYYTYSAVDTVHGVASNIEHPFLVKLIVGASIGVLGDWWLAWRLPIVLFSVLAVGLTYLVARKFLSEKLSLFATALVSLSTIFMLVGSCAILDMPTLAFGLAGLYVALLAKDAASRKNELQLYGLAGLLFGLGFLCKELAVVMFLPTIVYLAILKVPKAKLLWFGGVAFCVAFFGVWLYDLIYASSSAIDISNPVVHWITIVAYQLKLNTVTRATEIFPWYPPWAWVSPFGANALTPLKWIAWSNGWAWQAASNWAVEYLTFPLLGVLPVLYWLKRKSVALLSWLWIASTFLPWLVAGLFIRMEANFYIIYSVPFLAIGSAYLYTHIHNKKLRWSLAIGQLAVGVICFIVYFPIPLL